MYVILQDLWRRVILPNKNAISSTCKISEVLAKHRVAGMLTVSGNMQVTFLFNAWYMWMWLSTDKIGEGYKHQDLADDGPDQWRDWLCGGEIWWDQSANMFVSNEHSGHFRLWTDKKRIDYILAMASTGFKVLHIPWQSSICLNEPDATNIVQLQQDNLLRRRGNSICNTSLFKCIFLAGVTEKKPLRATRLYEDGSHLCLRPQFCNVGWLDVQFIKSRGEIDSPDEVDNIFHSHGLLQDRNVS